MKCEETRKNLDLYLDSEILSEEERESIRAHLESCETCRREYEEMKTIQDELKKLGEVELPEGFHVNLMKEVRKHHGKKESFFKRHYRWSLAAAAVLMVGILTTGGIQMLSGSGLRGLISANSQTEMAMDYGAPAMEAPAEEPAAISKYGDGYATEEAALEMDERAVTTTGSGEVYDERKIIKSVYIELDTEAIEDTFARIAGQVDVLGGYVEYSTLGDFYYSYYNRTESTERMRNANINARVPADQLDTMVAFVEGQGEVRTKSLNTVDQSDYYYDMDAQVENLKVREARLRELMDEAEEIGDIIQVENELARVRNEIDYLTRSMRYIDKDVDYSTVNIQLREVMTTSRIDTEDRNLWQEAKEGLIKNINRLIRFLQSAVVWAISFLPILIVAAAAVVVAYILLKKIAKRRKS